MPLLIYFVILLFEPPFKFFFCDSDLHKTLDEGCSGAGNLNRQFPANKPPKLGVRMLGHSSHKFRLAAYAVGRLFNDTLADAHRNFSVSSDQFSLHLNRRALSQVFGLPWLLWFWPDKMQRLSRIVLLALLLTFTQYDLASRFKDGSTKLRFKLIPTQLPSKPMAYSGGTERGNQVLAGLLNPFPPLASPERQAVPTRFPLFQAVLFLSSSALAAAGPVLDSRQAACGLIWFSRFRASSRSRSGAVITLSGNIESAVERTGEYRFLTQILISLVRRRAIPFAYCLEACLMGEMHTALRP